MDFNFNYADFTAADVAKKFRPIPFWSWNAELEEEELLRQIHEMHDAGMGGFIMHARGGLKTEYLGEKWIECINVCTREALKLGMLPYLYDENGWPSGFGNGMVNGLGEKYQQKCMQFTERDGSDAALPENIIATFDSNFKQTEPENAKYIVHYEYNKYYVDTMDPEVTDKFIELVYEHYNKTLPKDVRDGIVGIFTDEPQISRATAPWSWTMEREYRREYNEELIPRIIELFKEVGDYKRTRIRYYRLCAQLFRFHFIEKIGHWCEAHDWKLIGHHACEETYAVQLYCNGAIMPQYCGYTIPGDDHLGKGEAYVTVDTQVVSAAAQLGKKQILTETFGCSGWNFNMRGMEWLYHLQMLHGINYLCQHLEGYSLRGLRKRDYPMSVFYQHPMWKDIRPQNDAFSRVGGMLACGEIECDTVILHGQSSAQIPADGIHYFTDTAYDCWGSLQIISEKMVAAGIPFHFADEILTTEMGSVENGLFKIGKMSYKVFLIPQIINIPAAILELLKKFQAEGGLIRASKYNDFDKISVDGEAISAEDAAFLKSLATFDEMEDNCCEFVTAAARYIDCRVLEGVQGQIRGTWRAFPEQNEHWYFLVDSAALPENGIETNWKKTPLHLDNLGSESPVKAEITLPYAADEIWCIDQVTGKAVEKLQHLNINGKAKFFHEFQARGSMLLKAVNYRKGNPMDLTNDWKITSGKNVLLIDKADYRRADDGVLVKDCNTLTIFERMLTLPDTTVELFFRFNCAKGFDFTKANLAMAVERDPAAEYYLNGSKLPNNFSGYFIDRGIEVLALPVELLKEGENEFKIVQPFAQSKEIRTNLERARVFESESNKLYFDSEIEAIYLLGDFHCNVDKVTPETTRTAFVNGDFCISNSKETISLANFIDAGLVFFSGILTVSREFELTEDDAKLLRKLNFSAFKANSVAVTLNGTKLPIIYTAPYHLEIAGLLKPGKNTIQLEIATSCRNTLGPMHMTEVEPYAVGPTSFLVETNSFGKRPPEFTEDFGVLDYGFDVTLM